MAQDIILGTRGLTKGFRGFTVVPNINLRVRRGSVYVLIGPNGVGRTTCFNLLTKFLVSTRGTVLFDGVGIMSEKSTQIVCHGVIRSFQTSAVFPYLTVMESVRVGLQRQLGTAYAFQYNEQSLNTLNTRAMKLLEQVGLTEFAHTMTMELSYGHKCALEAVIMLVMEPELILLNKPTQGVDHEDADRMTELIKCVMQGRTTPMVKRNMNMVSSTADKITVLQRGQALAEDPYEDVSKNPQVMEAYMGTADAVLEDH